MEPIQNSELNEGWETWVTPKDSFDHGGDIVEVKNAETGNIILRGRVTAWTDLFGSGGILREDSDGNFQEGMPFPQGANEFREKMEKLRIRVVEPNDNRLDSTEAA